METMTNNVSTIHGWAKAAKALGCSPTGLRRLVAAGPLEIPKDDKGIGQFSPSIMATLREALAHGWPDPPGAQAGETSSGGENRASAPQAPPPVAAIEAPVPASASAPAPADQAQARVPRWDPGAQAAEAFRVFDSGAGPTELVIVYEVEPTVAMELHEAWKTAKAADREADQLREALDTLRHLEKHDWTCADVLEAWSRVRAAEELYEDQDFTGDAALALLRIVRDRGWRFDEAVEALRALPTLEEQERQAHHAQAVTAGAQRALGQAQAELRALAPLVGWLRLAEALAALVAGEGGAALAVRDALARVPSVAVADQALDQVDPDHETDARRMLAVWAVAQLPELVVPRAEHEAALRRARHDRSMEDVLAGMMMAGM